MAHEPTYRRVVVAFDSTRASRTALDLSASLASMFDAELAGLFIEDVNQLRLGALPFTRLTGPGPVSRDVDARTIERSMRHAASEARASLMRLAERPAAPVSWSFRVVRGAISRELGAAAETEDLIVVDERTLGRAAREALTAGRTSVLCLCSGAASANDVFVVYGDTDPDRRAIAMAVRVARATGRSLTLFVTETDRIEDASALVESADVPVRTARIADRTKALVQAVAQQPGAIVVRPAENEESETRQALVPLLESGRLSLLLTK